ncbi:unnamed protein product [Mycena citricolor]|uniref:Uncharacterized protein n=1 Tax=Mycena citricolor TaxID=2018698 RepID=A0AAD2Q835_9AGAR|nr:unnamed protein product [Mycena citricolor]
MADSASQTSGAPRGRGRGKSRGGLGKYLRARGRGRGGGGRAAEFAPRLLLEGEVGPSARYVTADGEEDEDARREREEREANLRRKYGRRGLGTNADRYKEEEPELDSDGEPIVEPEVDLSSFLERQRLEDPRAPPLGSSDRQHEDDEDDVDHSLDHISSMPARSTNVLPNRKGKAQEIVWDDSLQVLSEEKQAADALRELKSRFRAKSDKLRRAPVVPLKKAEIQPVIAPPLPLPDGSLPPIKSEMDEMEDFLDDLIG